MPHIAVGHPGCDIEMADVKNMGHRTENAGAREQPQSFEELRRKRAVLRKKLRLELQASQPQGTNYWTKHRGQGNVLPTKRVYPQGFAGQM